MNTPPTTAPLPTVSACEIAELVAWARRLGEAGANADPHERATYLAAKADLLARLAGEQATP